MSASAVMIHKEALYQVYAPLPFYGEVVGFKWVSHGPVPKGRAPALPDLGVLLYL